MVAPAAQSADLTAVALLDEPVRRRLYEWVCTQARPVGREEAARETGVSRPLAAFHLDRLAEAGLLDAGYQRLTGRSGPGAGRPARVYWRSQREFALSFPPRQYELVADVFATALQEIGGGQPPRELRDAAHDAGEQLARNAPEHGSGGGLFGVLEAAGYEPATEADGTIRLRNCPFDALVDEHRPLVCGTNLALAEGIVDGARRPGTTDYEPRIDSQPGFCCVVYTPKQEDV
jgi:predicted ArsR family transcriptional regulator